MYNFEKLETICPACVGILQHADGSQVIDPIVSKLETENYMATTYVLSLTLPTSMLPRNHSLALHVYNKLLEQGQNAAVASMVRADLLDSKDPIKTVLAYHIKERYNIQQVVDSPLKMTVVFDHPETVGDHVFLASVSSPLMKLVKQRKKVCT